MPQALSTQDVSQMVRLVRSDWQVTDATPITRGTDTLTSVTVETPTGPRECVLKACTTVPPEDFRPEPYLLELLDRETSVPVPSVVGAVEDHADLPAPFYLMERVAGVAADDCDLTRELVEQIARAAGRYAGMYHEMASFERFGRLRLDTDLTEGETGVTVDDRTLVWFAEWLADQPEDVREEASDGHRAYFNELI